MQEDKSASLTLLRHCLQGVAPLPDDAWRAAEVMFSCKSYPAGEHVIAAGEVVTELHFLTSGLARYYYLDEKGREFNKSFSTTGQVLSSVLSLVTGEPTRFSVQVLEASQCLSLRYKDFLDLAESYRDWERLRLRLLEQLVLKQERRAADLLISSATERYLRFLAEFDHVAGRIPNYHIASFLGITEVALSRIRKRLGLTRVNANR